VDEAEIAEWLKDLSDMMDGTGKHEGHTLTQVGRCVYCSCGQRVQGTIPEERRQ
jgi:hypothetical protein